jgi:hypothetical protein
VDPLVVAAQLPGPKHGIGGEDGQRAGDLLAAIVRMSELQQIGHQIDASGDDGLRPRADHPFIPQAVQRGQNPLDPFSHFQIVTLPR